MVCQDLFENSKQVTRHNKNWIGRDGKKEAEREEIRIKSKTYTQFENIKLNELFELYYKSIVNNQKKSSLRKEKDNYNLFIKNTLGNKCVKKITSTDIIDFHNYLDEQKIIIKNEYSKKGVGEHPLSISYKQSIHTTLSSILNFGCKYIGLEKNVAKIVGNFKTPKGTKKNEMNILTISEFENFIYFKENDIYKRFFTILFYTGMRRGELLALTVDDINFETREINIDKAINPKNGVLAELPKTDKSNRKIKMVNKVFDLLKEYVPICNQELFGLQKIKPTTLQRKCDNNCKKANITRNIRIHDFRHSFASMCIDKSVPIEVISEYLGHENILTTLETYAHLYPNSQDKLINILGDI